MKNKNTALLNQFDIAIQEVDENSKLSKFLIEYRNKLLNNKLKGIEISQFIDGISKIIRKDHQNVPHSVLKLMSMVQYRGIWNGFGLGLRML
ncbi:bacteriocin immunity protein [Weissella fangxianensis]|uniref:bacteriocin immunity protein n=1 Tax=Weissella fangxianensis TaxID=2953879 RepID=UPI0021570D3A|nr:bacteriocin immunity protein [Weissella fangxianensis]